MESYLGHSDTVGEAMRQKCFGIDAEEGSTCPSVSPSKSVALHWRGPLMVEEGALTVDRLPITTISRLKIGPGL